MFTWRVRCLSLSYDYGVTKWVTFQLRQCNKNGETLLTNYNSLGDALLALCSLWK